jgi:hypothetical protein
MADFTFDSSRARIERQGIRQAQTEQAAAPTPSRLPPAMQSQANVAPVFQIDASRARTEGHELHAQQAAVLRKHFGAQGPGAASAAGGGVGATASAPTMMQAAPMMVASQDASSGAGGGGVSAPSARSGGSGGDATYDAGGDMMAQGHHAGGAEGATLVHGEAGGLSAWFASLSEKEKMVLAVAIAAAIGAIVYYVKTRKKGRGRR